MLLPRCRACFAPRAPKNLAEAEAQLERVPSLANCYETSDAEPRGDRVSNGDVDPDDYELTVASCDTCEASSHYWEVVAELLLLIHSHGCTHVPLCTHL